MHWSFRKRSVPDHTTAQLSFSFIMSDHKRKAPSGEDEESPGAKRERTQEENGQIYDLAKTFGYHDGDRLEVSWELESNGQIESRWWGATLLPWDSKDIVDGNVAVRRLAYDAYPEAGFEVSEERVVFLGDTLIDYETKAELDFRREGNGEEEPSIEADPSKLMEQIIKSAFEKRKDQFAKLPRSQQAIIASQLAEVTDKVVDNLEKIRARGGVVTASKVNELVANLSRE